MPEQPPHDDEVEALLATYVEAHERGEAPDLEEWLKAVPEVADRPALRAALIRAHQDWLRAGPVLAKALPAGGTHFFRPGSRPGKPDPIAPHNLGAGSVIDDYRLIRFLDKGGMGQVWEAEQISLKRRVALKLVLPDRVDSKSLEFFAREARAGGRLNHPNIVQTYAHGTSEGLAWIAQELVEGSWTLKDSLDALRAEEDLPDDYYRSVAAFLQKVAEALQVAHDAGVIHRDIKPQNILITESDEPKLTDFGLARITYETALSVTGDFAGTYAYMSPEQVAAKRIGLDHRTDIFSLGVVMYEMLALRRPFEGDTTQQVAYQILQREPPSLRSVKSRCPRALETICEKMLEKDRAQRFDQARLIADETSRFSRGEPIRSSPPSSLRVLLRWCARRPLFTGIAFSIGLGAVASVAVAVYVQGQNRIISANKRAADVQRDAALRSQYTASVRAAELSIRSGNTAEARNHLDSSPEELRGWEWGHLSLVADLSSQWLRDPSLPSTRFWQLAWHPSGQMLAASPEAFGLPRVWSVLTGDLLPILGAAEDQAELVAAKTIEWSQDGALLAYALDHPDRVEVCDTSTGEIVARLSDAILGVVAWHPNGRYLAMPAQPSGVKIWDREFRTTQLLEFEGVATALSWEAESGALAAGASDGTMYVWSFPEMELSTQFQAHEDRVSFVGWQPNGLLLASASKGEGVVWRGRQRVAVFTKAPSLDPWVHLSWAPSGTYLASVSSEGVQIWDTQSVETVEPSVVCGSVSWSPGADRLAVMDCAGSLRLWDVEQLVQLGEIAVGSHSRVSWSPSGKALATANAEGVRVWSSSTRGGAVELPLIKRRRYFSSSLSWSRSGSELITEGAEGVSIWSAVDGQLLAVMEGDRPVASPNDSLMIVGREGYLQVVDMDDSRVVAQLDGQEASWGPGGKLVVADKTGDRAMTVRDAQEGGSIVKVTAAESVEDEREAPAPFDYVSWSPDGSRCVSAYHDEHGCGSSACHRAILWDAGDWSAVGSFHLDLYPSDPFVTWSSSGEYFLYGSLVKVRRSNDLEVVAQLRETRRVMQSLNCAVWNPEGRRVALAAGKLVEVHDVRGDSDVLSLEGHRYAVNAVAWSPDGGRLGTGASDGEIRVWSSDGRLLTVLSGHTSSVEGIAWSVDGEDLATIDQDGRTRVWHSSLDGAVRWGAETGMANRALALYSEACQLDPRVDSVIETVRNMSAPASVRQEAARLAEVLPAPSPAELDRFARTSLNTDATDRARSAIECARIACELEPGNADYLETLTRALSWGGFQDQARASLERLLEASTHEQRAQYERSFQHLRD